MGLGRQVMEAKVKGLEAEVMKVKMLLENHGVVLTKISEMVVEDQEKELS